MDLLGELRGRDEEHDRIVRVLRRARTPSPTVVIIEGSVGIGKTRLLQKVIAAAGDQDYTVLSFAPPARPARRTQRYPWLIDQLQARIAKHAAASPVLVAVDDLHQAPTEWLAALTTLIQRPTDQQVVWVLSQRAGGGDVWVDQLHTLSSATVERVELGPLSSAAVATVVADLIGEPPALDLLTTAAAAKGNPFFLIEIVEGLREEGRLKLGSQGHQVVSHTLPHRIGVHVRQQTTALSPQCRHLLQVAAILGQTFAPQSLAQLLCSSVANLLPAIEESLTAGILTMVDQHLAFSHELVWQGMFESIRPPLRDTVRHEANLIHDSIIPGSAARGDPVHTGTAGTASVLAVGSRERQASVAGPDEHPDQYTDQGQPPPVGDVLHQAAPYPATGEPQSRQAHMLIMRGRVRQGIEAAQQALASAHLRDEVRADAMAARLLGLSMSDEKAAIQAAQAVLAQRNPPVPTATADAAVVMASTVQSDAAWEAGCLSEGLHHGRQAVALIHPTAPSPWSAHAQLSLAQKLADVRCVEDAEAIIRRAQLEIDRFGLTIHSASLAVARARLLLQAGQLSQARTEARSALAKARELYTELLVPPAYSVMASVALRTGDLLSAAYYIKRCRADIAATTIPLWSVQYDWVDLLFAADQDGARRAADLMYQRYPDLPMRRSLYIKEPGAAAWLVRLAAIVGDTDLAVTTVTIAGQLAANNPAFPTVGVGALHARGLFNKDLGLLTQAAEEHREPWAAAWAAEDLGNQLLHQYRSDSQAVGCYETALTRFEQIGSASDIARVRRRLRSFGVRRRGVGSPRQLDSGWESLSETDRTIAHLVDQGLTNRQIASRVFVSSHTINYRLRQIFRRLDISSRLELARLAREYQVVD